MIASKNANNPHSYLLYERWEDEAEFTQIQMQRAYRIEYNEKIQALEKEARKVFI
jgi:quinol monooxygenase YgiN